MSVHIIYNLNELPNLKKLLEEMAFDSGVARDEFLPQASKVLAPLGKYDIIKLEKLATEAWKIETLQVVTQEEIDALYSGFPTYKPGDYKADILARQLVGGAGEVNDAIATKGEWNFLLSFLDEVFVG